MLICIAYYLFYVVSLFAGNKRIMAEGIMIAQIAYAAIAAVPVLNPL